MTDLRSTISRDLEPVEPLPAPVVRALAIAPFGLLLLFAASAVFSVRDDAPRLGFLLTWGASGLQVTAAIALVVAALREAVPGTLLQKWMIRAAFAGAALLVAGLTWTTWMVSGSRLAMDPTGFVWKVCVAGTILSALPPLVASAWLVARAYPLRPAVAGALYGLASGLMADAGWRLFCHYADPAHVFGAHVLGIAAVTLLGAGVAAGLSRLSRPR